MQYIDFGDLVPAQVCPVQRPAAAPTLSIEQLARSYRLDALNGIFYAWGNPEINDLSSIDGAADFDPIEQSPRRSYVARERTPAPSLVSINGKRLPLRAIPYLELERHFWSKGKVVFPEALERNTPRELLAHEKQPEDMTLAELIDTQDREPLTESRRSFLTTGVGVLHLDATDYDEGSIGEAVAAELNLAFEHTFETEPSVDEIERDAIRYGTPYETLDPTTAKQIDWERAAWHGSEIRTIKVEDGKVKVDRRFPTQEQFIAAVKRHIDFLLPSAGSDAKLESRVKKLSADAVKLLCRKFDRYVAGEIERATYESGERDIWASSWEDASGFLHHRTGLRSKDEFWHTRPQDRAEVALVNHEGSDEEIEDLLGVDDCPNYVWGRTCFGTMKHIDGYGFAACTDCGELVNYGDVVPGMGLFTETGWHKALAPKLALVA